MTETTDATTTPGDPLAEPTDRDLLAAHVAGDAYAFGTLFSRHADRLWTLALRTCGNPADAADALQDAAVSAFRKAAGFRGEAAVSTWLHRVVVNACLDRLRYLSRRAASELPDDSRLPVTAHVDPVEERETRLAVAEALGRLSADQRAAVVLIDMEGYSVDEAAKLLGCAPGTVKSRCSRARAKLAVLLGDLMREA